MKPTGRDVLRAAAAISPAQGTAPAAWLINQQPAHMRHRLVTEIQESIRSDYLSGGQFSSWTAPQLFGFEDANQLWDDICTSLHGPGAQRQIAPSDLDQLASYFKPNPAAFAPVAYPGRWIPPHWSAPLSPAQVRSYLRMTERDCEEIIGVLTRCSGARTINVASIDRGSRGLEEEPAPARHLRVGVIPYCDTLALAAILYAVSDQFEQIEFREASFYQDRQTQGSMLYVLNDYFDFGYATESELNDYRAQARYVATKVFHEPFTRSIVLRQWRHGGARIPNFDTLSLVGEFVKEQIFAFDKDSVDLGFPDEVICQKIALTDLSRRLDPVVDWEPELMLAFMSSLQRPDSLSSVVQGQALFLSTDAYSWANYCGLVGGHESTWVSLGRETSDQAGSRAGSRDRDGVRFGKASWTPNAYNPRFSAIPDIDRYSTLCWFGPSSMREIDRRTLDRLIMHLVVHPVQQALNHPMELPLPDNLHHEAATIGRCLLAPLLASYPWYRGPLVLAPPADWLTKLTGAGAHIRHIPDWRRRVSTLLAAEAADATQDDLALLRRLLEAA